MLKGFKSFLMRDSVITVAVGLVVATAFSTLVKSFTDSIINPLIARLQPNTGFGLGYQLNPDCTGEACKTTFLDAGSLISAIIYFIVFMAVVYFLIVLPYKHIQARRGIVVFDEDAPAEPEEPTKVCEECLANDLPVAARKCRYCGSLQITN